MFSARTRTGEAGIIGKTWKAATAQDCEVQTAARKNISGKRRGQLVSVVAGGEGLVSALHGCGRAEAVRKQAPLSWLPKKVRRGRHRGDWQATLCVRVT